MIFYLAEIQEIIGYEFKNSLLLRQCFTHSSYANEHKFEDSNERLEFLGDSVLGLIVSDFLFKKDWKKDEGNMTNEKQKLVSTKPLAYIIKQMKLDVHIILGEGSSVTEKLCENLYEAIVAGIYLDGGYDEASKFVYRTLLDNSEKETIESNVQDYKSKLNEYCQKNKLGLVVYVQNSKEGLDNDPLFRMTATIQNKSVSTGVGKSKRAAEQEAAKKALEKFTKPIESNKQNSKDNVNKNCKNGKVNFNTNDNNSKKDGYKKTNFDKNNTDKQDKVNFEKKDNKFDKTNKAPKKKNSTIKQNPFARVDINDPDSQTSKKKFDNTKKGEKPNGQKPYNKTNMNKKKNNNKQNKQVGTPINHKGNKDA